MYRNLMSRWWTIALACVLGLALLAASVPTRSLAGSVPTSPGSVDPGLPPPGPVASGDPDSPSNTGSPTTVSTRVDGVGTPRQVTSGPGQTWTARDVWVMKVRIAFQMVRVFYLHD